MAYNATLMSAVSGSIKEIMGAQATHRANMDEMVRKYFRAGIMQAFEHRSTIIARDCVRLMNDNNFPLFKAACKPYYKGLKAFADERVFSEGKLVDASQQNDVCKAIQELDMGNLNTIEKPYENPLYKLLGDSVSCNDSGRLAMACFFMMRDKATTVLNKCETEEDLEFTNKAIKMLNSLIVRTTEVPA